MTDYASSVTAADPSWTWWMTTAAAAAMRMRNLRDHHHGGRGDADDEFAGPDSKRPRVKDEYWTGSSYDRDEDGSSLHDSAAAVGPLDLSVKATLTTAAAAAAAAAASSAGRAVGARTPVKRPAGATVNGRSSKKTAVKPQVGGATAAAVKAATRKLLPQLMLDQRVDRSSPVSGTIIVPATPDDPRSAGGPTTSPRPSSPYGDCADDDYDGGDIDPEFNVVVATDEARRRLESIPNALGPYRCRLCSVRYADAFALARHRCRCIVHVRYRCPECDKVFQCPANLASHRRWHGTGAKTSGGGVGHNNNNNNNNNNSSSNNNNNDDEKLQVGETVDGGKPLEEAIDDDVNICGGGADEDRAVQAGGETTGPTTSSAAGFKKNILQRAAAAAAAAATRDDAAGVARNALQ